MTKVKTGGNIIDYVCFDGNAPYTKFLTKFDTIIHTIGWPNSINIILNENTVDSNTVVVLKTYTSNGTPVATVTSNVPDTIQFLRININHLIGDSTAKKAQIYITQTIDEVEDTVVSELKNILIHDECANPVLLYWRNSLGGDTFFMFELAQDLVYTTNLKRALRKTIYAEHITTNQWEAFNDLNNLNAVYGEQYNDIRDINKTSKMIGQQMYVFDKDGQKTGVITIPTTNNTTNKVSLHRFQMEIEYPEYFVQ